MASVVRMPEVLANSSEAAIQTWLVVEGQAVAIGTPLAEVETEKAIVEYAAEVAGTVLRLLVTEGAPVTVGDPIAIVGVPGEAVTDAGPQTLTPTSAAPEASPQDQAAAAASARGPAAAAAEAARPAPAGPPMIAHARVGARLFMSPLVRRLARERGLDVTSLDGSGPGGRIVRRDLDRLEPPLRAAPLVTADRVSAEPAPVAAAFTDVPHTAMRRAIARRLTESKSTVPHFYLVAHCRVDALVALRASVNETSPLKISINDLVIKAVAAALGDVPEANATWGDSATRRYSTVDLSVAVAIDGGLVTPVLRAVETMSLSQIARSVADLAERARAGRLRQHELEGGSFAVSNLGMHGVSEFSAIINPPQSGILAIGAAGQRAIVVDGALEVATMMTVTLSADHRVLDGALAAQWLAAFVRRIESPAGMLA